MSSIRAISLRRFIELYGIAGPGGVIIDARLNAINPLADEENFKRLFIYVGEDGITCVIERRVLKSINCPRESQTACVSFNKF